MKDLDQSPNDPNYGNGIMVDTPHDLVFQNTPELAEIILSKKLENQDSSEQLHQGEENGQRCNANQDGDHLQLGIQLRNKL